MLEIWAEKLDRFLEEGSVDELADLFEKEKIRPAADAMAKTRAALEGAGMRGAEAEGSKKE